MNFNATRIQCMAVFNTSEIVSSPAAILLIQGRLDPVDSLNIAEQNNIVSLTWLPPFTLDIFSEDPDIRGYCVDIFNSTSNMLIYSKCGLTKTLFQYPTPDDSICHSYKFTVTPVNVVGNGTSSTVSYFGTETSPEVDEFTLRPESTSEYEITILMTAPVCSIQLISDPTSTFTVDHVNNTMITQFPVNRHYNVTVNASNSAGSTLSPPFTISTHDIVNATATGNAEKFTITATFSEYSNAVGALINFAYLNDKGDLSFYLLALNRSDSMEYNIPNFLLFKSLVRISVYDIESDGVIFNDGDVHVSYPADTMEATGTESSTTTTLLEQEGISCSSTTTFSLIKITCTSRNSLRSGIQFIAQSSGLKEKEKLYVSEKFAIGIDTTAEITIPIKMGGTYQITGFSIGENLMIDSVVYINRVKLLLAKSLATGTLATMDTIMCCVLIGILGIWLL